MTEPNTETQVRPARPCIHPQANHQHGTRAAYVLDRCRCPACSTANTVQARRRTTEIAYGRWRGLVDASPVRQHVQALRQAGLSLPRISALAGVGHGTLNSLVYGEPARGKPPSARLRSDTATRLLDLQLDETLDATRATADGDQQPPAPPNGGDSACRQRILRSQARRDPQEAPVSTHNGWAARGPGAGELVPKRSTRAPLSLHPEHQSPDADHPGCVLTGARARATTQPDAFDGTGELSGEEDLDEVAIERAMTGELVPLTRLERHDAVRQLTRQGRSAAQIADLLHVNRRTITRARAAARASAAGSVTSPRPR